MVLYWRDSAGSAAADSRNSHPGLGDGWLIEKFSNIRISSIEKVRLAERQMFAMNDNLVYQVQAAFQAGQWDESRRLCQQMSDYPGVQALLADLDNFETAEQKVKELIQTGAEQLRTGAFQEAFNTYREAHDLLFRQAHPGLINKYQAELDEKRGRIRQVATWRGKVNRAIREIQEYSQQEQWEVICQRLEHLQRTLPDDPAYQSMAAQLSQIILQVREEQAIETRYQQAEEAYLAQNFERVIELLKDIPPESAGYQKARRLYQMAEDDFQTNLSPVLSQTQADLRQNRPADALARLHKVRQKFGSNQLWDDLWLQASQAYGQQKIDRGIHAGQEQNFQLAQDYFKQAAEIFRWVLQRYPTHLAVTDQYNQAITLAQIAQIILHARHDDQVEHPQAALDRLEKALTRLKANPYDSTPLRQEIEKIGRAIRDKKKQLEQAEQTLTEAQQLLQKRKLSQAKECFLAVQHKALLPRRRQLAQSGVAEVETKIAAFFNLVGKGHTEKAADLQAAITSFQEAYFQWPDGPAIAETLYAALLQAGHEALAKGQIKEAACCFLQAEDIPHPPDSKESPALELQKIRSSDAGFIAWLEALHHQALADLEKLPDLLEVNAVDFSQLHSIATWLETFDKKGARDDLEQQLDRLDVDSIYFRVFYRITKKLVSALAQVQTDELKKEIDSTLRRIRNYIDGWKKFEALYHQTWTAFEAGQWQEATEFYGGAQRQFRHRSLSIENQRNLFEQTLQIVQASLEAAQTAWQQVETAYQQVTQSYDPAPALTLLAQIEDELDQAGQAVQALNLPRQPRPLLEQAAQVEDLRRRLEAIELCFIPVTAGSRLDQVQSLRQEWPDDPVVAALEQSLLKQLRNEYTELLQEIESMLHAGKVDQAALRLDEVRSKWSTHLEGTDCSIRLQQLSEWIEQWLQLQTGCRLKRDEGDLAQAASLLRRSIDMFLVRSISLPVEAQQVLSEIIALGSQETVGQNENWQQALAKLAQLKRLDVSNQPTCQAADRLALWLYFNRCLVMRGLINNACLAADLSTAAQTAQILLNDLPTEAWAAWQKIEIQAQLSDRLDDLAEQYLTQARRAIEQGEIAPAVETPSPVEQLYQKAAAWFPQLQEREELDLFYREAALLQIQAERWQAIRAAQVHTIEVILNQAEITLRQREFTLTHYELARLTAMLETVPAIQRLDLERRCRDIQVRLQETEKLHTSYEQARAILEDEHAINQPDQLDLAGKQLSTIFSYPAAAGEAGQDLQAKAELLLREMLAKSFSGLEATETETRLKILLEAIPGHPLLQHYYEQLEETQRLQRQQAEFINRLNQAAGRLEQVYQQIQTAVTAEMRQAIKQELAEQRNRLREEWRIENINDLKRVWSLVRAGTLLAAINQPTLEKAITHLYKQTVHAVAAASQQNRAEIEQSRQSLMAEIKPFYQPTEPAQTQNLPSESNQL